MQFAYAKMRPPPTPQTLVPRQELHRRLSGAGGRRLSVVVGSAGAGKTVVLGGWAETRAPGATSWLSCDESDQDPHRFWTGFVESIRVAASGFGPTAADQLSMRTVALPDVIASIVNDLQKLPAGFAVIVDDLHETSGAVDRDLTELVDRWPHGGARLVLASRHDPQVRLHRLRMTGDLFELRQTELNFTLSESRALFAAFGVEVDDRDLELLHQRTEGWPAAVQMAALAVRGPHGRHHLDRLVEVRHHEVSDYLVSEVLQQLPPDQADFMLKVSVLGELTAESCAAVSGSQDAGTRLRELHAAHLFLVALDDEHTRFRFHHLFRDALRAELRIHDSSAERQLQLMAAQWYEQLGDARQASHHLLAARDGGSALKLARDRLVTAFQRDPTTSTSLDGDLVDPSLLSENPENVLTLAIDALLAGDVRRGALYLDAYDGLPPGEVDDQTTARVSMVRAMLAVHCGRADEASAHVRDARTVCELSEVGEGWPETASIVMLRVHTWTHDDEAANDEVRALRPLAEAPVGLVMVPGLVAAAHFDAGRLAEAEAAAIGADAQARRLGLTDHYFSTDYLRVLIGLALERGDLERARELSERAVLIARGHAPQREFLAVVDTAHVQAATGRVREALTTIASARRSLDARPSVLTARADEAEALLRLELGDRRSPLELAEFLPDAASRLIRARTSLDSGDHDSAARHLRGLAGNDLTPRQDVVRRLLMGSIALERRDPGGDRATAAAIDIALERGFTRTVATVAPPVARFIIEHAVPGHSDEQTDALVAAAVDARAMRSEGRSAGSPLYELRRSSASSAATDGAVQLTPAELRLLPYLQTHLSAAAIAERLYLSRHTVNTQIKSIYRKLHVSSRAEAVDQATARGLLGG